MTSHRISTPSAPADPTVRGERDVRLGEDEIRNRILGAWLGRAAGCSLGKPVEGWLRERIDAYLESTNALPLDDYIPYTEGEIHPRLKSSTRGNIECMARDDDLDYPILGLLALEGHGADLTSRNMANTWLSRMPFYLLYTAESAAYRNLVNRRWPPESATWRNPFREWIGAQIRADIFGYVSPGWPERAAELAFRDACMSHVKNGIYGEMFVAAMLAATFATDDIDEIIDVGLSEIPANCRLAEAVRETRAWCHATTDWEEVWDRINRAIRALPPRAHDQQRGARSHGAVLRRAGLRPRHRRYRPRRMGHRLQRGHRRFHPRRSIGRGRTAGEVDRRSRRPAPFLRARLQRQPDLRACRTHASRSDGDDRGQLAAARLRGTHAASTLWYKAARSNAARRFGLRSRLQPQ